MSASAPWPLPVRANAERLEWWAGHCGTCPACTAGHEAWCTDYAGPSREGDRDDLGWHPVDRVPLAELDPVACAAAAVVLDVVAGRQTPDPCVLVVGVPDHSDELGNALLAAGTTVVTEPTVRPERLSPRTRQQLADRSGSGRPDVVVTFGGSLAGCARWVRRGGVVASCPWWLDEPDPPVALDTVTMREVTVRPVRRPHVQLSGSSQA